jgi:hypothetical protein
MVDEQDVTIATLQLRLKTAEETLARVEAVAYSLRDDRLRIEGGKWVLWCLGGLFFAMATLWYSLTNSPSLQRFLGLHGG